MELIQLHRELADKGFFTIKTEEERIPFYKAWIDHLFLVNDETPEIILDLCIERGSVPLNGGWFMVLLEDKEETDV